MCDDIGNDRDQNLVEKKPQIFKMISSTLSKNIDT